MGIRAKTILKRGVCRTYVICTHVRQTPLTCILRYLQTLLLQGFLKIAILESFV